MAADGTESGEKSTDNGTVEPIVIKKYANRRLYNTASGEFVTLETLHQLVADDVLFVVQDAKSGKDLTASILAQIIAEEETKGHNILPLNMLRQLLKYYGDGVGPQFSNYLEHSIESFTKNQHEMMKQMTDMFSGTAGMDNWAEMSRRNLELFQNSFNMFGANGQAPGAPTPETTPPPPTEAPSSQTDIDRMSEQLAEMQKQLESLSKKP